MVLKWSFCSVTTTNILTQHVQELLCFLYSTIQFLWMGMLLTFQMFIVLKNFSFHPFYIKTSQSELQRHFNTVNPLTNAHYNINFLKTQHLADVYEKSCTYLYNFFI